MTVWALCFPGDKIGPPASLHLFPDLRHPPDWHLGLLSSDCRHQDAPYCGVLGLVQHFDPGIANLELIPGAVPCEAGGVDYRRAILSGKSAS